MSYSERLERHKANRVTLQSLARYKILILENMEEQQVKNQKSPTER